MIPIQGFLQAPTSEQLLFVACLAAVVYGLVRGRRATGDSALVALLVVVGFFILAVAALNWVAAGGAL